MGESLAVAALHRSALFAVDRITCRAGRGRGHAEEVSRRGEIAFVLRGSFVREDRRGRIAGDSHHILFFDRAEPYTVHHPLEGGDDCVAISLRDEEIRELIGEGDGRCEDSEPRFSVGGVPNDAPLALLQASLLAVLTDPSEDSLAADEMVVCVAREAVKRTAGKRHAPPPDGRTERRHADLAEAARVVLSERLADPMALGEIARRLNTTPFHLARVFRRHAGEPLSRYRAVLRLREALRRLIEGERDLTSLALETGFYDHSHFTNAFRRHYGVVPSRARAVFSKPRSNRSAW